MQVDICVLTAGGRWDIFNQCLSAIKAQIDSSGHDIKTYVFNNGGNQNEFYERVKLLSWVTWKRSAKNNGFPTGANSAIKMGNSKYVLFITDDVILLDGFLDTALTKMADDQLIGVQGFKLIFPKNSNDQRRPAGKVQHVGHAFTLQGECIHPLVGWSVDNPKCCVSRELQSVTGAVMMFRRDVFSRVGGFDEVYGRGTYEDADICMKIRANKYKVWFNADAVAEHYTGATAEALQLPFPLNQNRHIFNERWLQKGFVQWDSWTWY